MVFKSDRQRKAVMAKLRGTNKINIIPIFKNPPSRIKRSIMLIDVMNKSALNPITDKFFASKLMVERMETRMYNDELWSKTSTDNKSGKLFEKRLSDPTLPIVFVDINFASKRKGNPLEGAGKSTQNIKRIISKNKKLDSVPIYDLKSSKIIEGNHRVQALKELGFKSIPVRISGGWD